MVLEWCVAISKVQIFVFRNKGSYSPKHCHELGLTITEI
jgi:hypothetical protein